MARVEERIDVGFGPSRGDLARLPWASFFIIAVLILVAVLAPLIAPHSPTEQSLPDKLTPPARQEGGSTKHLLGTDILGRDVLSRLIYGAPLTLLLAPAALLGGRSSRAAGRHVSTEPRGPVHRARSPAR